MNISLEQLQAIMPAAKARGAIFLPHLNAAMAEFGIDSPRRIAAFLAQVGHESGQLLYVRELASGRAYEGRKDLGNTSLGDGARYKGRGLIQITGRANYSRLASDLKIACVEKPELLETPENACRSAGWFWSKNSLNKYVDSGDFVWLTKRINGGTNGLADRQELYGRACKVLGI